MDAPERYEEPSTGILDDRVAGGGAVRALSVLGAVALLLFVCAGAALVLYRRL